jgi:predicted transcriptional regulator
MARKPPSKVVSELRSQTLAIRIKPSVKDALAEYAYRERSSASLIAEIAIEDFLRKKGAL